MLSKTHPRLSCCSHGADGTTPPASVISSMHHDLDLDAMERLRHSVEAGVTAGFQIASGTGPLCEEPLWGVAFEVTPLLRAQT